MKTWSFHTNRATGPLWIKNKNIYVKYIQIFEKNQGNFLMMLIIMIIIE